LFYSGSIRSRIPPLASDLSSDCRDFEAISDLQKQSIFIAQKLTELIAGLDAAKDRHAPLNFYGGRLGQALALSVIGRAFERDEILKAACFIAPETAPTQVLGLANGLAGFIYAQLVVGRNARRTRHISKALHVAMITLEHSICLAPQDLGDTDLLNALSKRSVVSSF
jgi:hypothetical protein